MKDKSFEELISELEEARFLVMVEEAVCGPDLKRALSTKGIFYCYLDDFYTGNIEDIKQRALFKEMQEYIQSNVNLNINEMFEYALLQTRIETTESEEKQFFKNPSNLKLPKLKGRCCPKL
jgi:hypothetical protein